MHAVLERHTTNSAEAAHRPADTLLLAGLVLFLALLPFHLVVKSLIPGPAGTYWKEFLLGLLVVLWLVRCVQERRLLLTGTRLDLPVLIYLGLMVAGFIAGRADAAARWGLYASVMYLPLVWLVPALLARRPDWLGRLAAVMIAAGGVLALGGLVEFVLNKPLWPSLEMVSRQGFADIYVYGTHLRRVYFVLDSPTALANVLSLLLPLALALAVLARRAFVRALLAVTALLMAACIVVTFSRGIWVAAGASLAAMALVSGRFQYRRRIFAGVLGVIFLAAVIWGVIALVRPGQGPSGGAALLELPADTYQAAPVSGTGVDLLPAPGSRSDLVQQTWTIQDPITSIADTRSVLFQHPIPTGQNGVTYSVAVPVPGALRFGIALSPEVWSPQKGDGVTFMIDLAETASTQGTQRIFTRYINPKVNPGDQRWRNFLVDLSPWAGHTVDLTLSTDAGPAGDDGYDWAGWAQPQVVGLAPGYFASAQVGNQAVEHAGSILNWTTDETNRDRLAAWNLAFSAWLRSPIWGQGLGSTGVAALRTGQGQAFVTESQVLKALVEFGLLGLLSLGFLWFSIARVGSRALRNATDPARRLLLLGILTGLLIVFVEGLVYQNLEVKQVNACFWTLTGMLGYLGSGKA